MPFRRSWTGLPLACALLVAPLAACASGRGGATDAVDSASASASAVASGAASGPGGAAHGPGGTSPDGGGTSGGTAPRGPGPGGTDASVPSPTSTSSAPAPGGSASAVGSGSASAGPAAGPPPTFDIKSDCPDTLVLYVGDKPKKSTGKDVSVAGRTTQSFPRAPDGTATVWIVDGKGEGVTSARVLASHKRVVIGLNCRSLQVE